MVTSTSLERPREPGGHSWDEVHPDTLRQQRTCIKFHRYPADVLPLFVAQMDYPVADEIRHELAERVQNSDFGYIDGPGELAPVFADFAQRRFGWTIQPEWVHITTDVATAVVEGLRLVLPHTGSRVAVTTPVYPGFFEMLEEFDTEVVEIEFAHSALPLAAIEAEAASESGLDALILCNPHNPHGIAWTAEELDALAKICAKHDIFVLSDEVHAPLTLSGTTFTPFGPVAAANGVRSFVATSASKAWNIAGAKGAMLVAVDDASNRVLSTLPPEVTTRVPILGLHANIVAFRDCEAWLDRAIQCIEFNIDLFDTLLKEQVPTAKLVRPRTGYLAWIDLRESGLGDPAQDLLRDGRIALGNGAYFGAGGEGFVRVNLACSPDTLREAVARIARTINAAATPDQKAQQ